MRRNGIQSGNRVFPANRAAGLLQPVGQLFLNRAGCPNRATATIANWMPVVQSMQIGSQSGRWSQSGEKTSCSNVLHAAQMRHDVRRHNFSDPTAMIYQYNIDPNVCCCSLFLSCSKSATRIIPFLSCSQSCKDDF